ncbi:MAG: reverse transcriptase domain-containing protein [Bacilli bacterium]|nr:reverse transcriptase domain-containing protein [Bacilli bacterium]
MCEQYLSNIKISDRCYAYVRKKSICDNAKQHKDNRCFLFVDITDFFGSLSFDIMEAVLIKRLNDVLSPQDINLLLRLCSYKGKFVQGCVSSPILSNIYMTEIDYCFSNLVNILPNGIYSRYSDDMVFSSSERIKNSLLNTIKKALKKYGLTINYKKTYFSSYLERIKITGLRLKNDKTISISTSYKKALKNSIHAKLKFLQNSRESCDNLLGKLSYLKMVDLPYYNSLNTKYRDGKVLLIDRLKKIRLEEHKD